MRLYVAATGSTGNSYVLSAASGESLILDAGVRIKSVLPHIPDVRKVSGCVLTHEHNDHAKGWRDYHQRGIRCLASRGTWDALGAPIDPVKSMSRVDLGGFRVLPFDTQHDAAEPLGYLIKYIPTGETAIYVTDTYYIKYTFPGVNYWFIECNYCDDLIDGETDLVLRNRLKQSHMSLKRLKDALAANDLTETAKIVLLHLSDKRSDEKRMEREIEELTGIETIAASAGMTIELSITPF